MGHPREQQPHTLAQFAERAGISDGRARALYAAKPSGLPAPDRVDAGGRPLWWASTIDIWCARTGREVSMDSLWLYRAPAARTPAAELRRGVVTLGRYGRPHTFYVIVWDTEHGHVVYLQPLEKKDEHKDRLAVHAAELIEPRWWSTAAVIMPLEENLESPLGDGPFAYVYRLTTAPDAEELQETETDGGAFGGLRRWFQRTATAEASAEPRAEWAGQQDLADLAKAIGHTIPLWLYDTETSVNAEQTLSYNRTFTVEDTVTAWPAVEKRLTRTVEIGMPGEFPAAFAALAVDAAEGLQALRAAHERMPDAGDGWYLVCRPARPAPPIDLEQRITGATLVTDTDLVAKELIELRTVEGELDCDDPRGDPYTEAITLLEWQLRRAAKASGAIRDSHDYAPVADDGFLPYSAPWEGPVVDAWRKTLTPLKDLDPLFRLRRIHRLLDERPLEQVREAYRDPEGRYVLVIELHAGVLWSRAEWPASPRAVSTWTDKTVLAADDGAQSVVTLLALTATDDGRMRVDPVPLPPRSDRDAFGYSYGGGTPTTTYHALLRCALGDIPELSKIRRLPGERHADGTPVSQLWAAISTTKGPLRLSWPQVQLWARADQKNTFVDK
ncbi:hypothetical protein [Candidatus Frankia alpina]|uniref:hypothetical protein n=1 Tax=Candidatus Frankia alpina TaxID=2699483 RepID=UPI0013D76908|nr:hypothetical protein [Candidatus Frankia alpina]